MSKALLGSLIGSLITLIIIGAFGYMFLGDNIAIERVEESHNKTVYLDGQLASSVDWNTILGYNVTIDVQVGTYIGR